MLWGRSKSPKGDKVDRSAIDDFYLTAAPFAEDLGEIIPDEMREEWVERQFLSSRYARTDSRNSPREVHRGQRAIAKFSKKLALELVPKIFSDPFGFPSKICSRGSRCICCRTGTIPRWKFTPASPVCKRPTGSGHKDLRRLQSSGWHERL